MPSRALSQPWTAGSGAGWGPRAHGRDGRRGRQVEHARAGPQQLRALREVEHEHAVARDRPAARADALRVAPEEARELGVAAPALEAVAAIECAEGAEGGVAQQLRHSESTTSPFSTGSREGRSSRPPRTCRGSPRS